MSGRQAPGLASPRVAATVPFRAAKAGCCPDGPAAGAPPATGLKLVAAYARVSSDKQEKEQTIDSQIDALRRAAEERGWPLLPDLICTDDGRSGATLARPGLDRLRDLIAEGTCAAVLVCSPDRLARNYAYQVLVIDGKRCSQAQHWSCLTWRINAGGEAELLQSPDVPVLEMKFRAGPAIWS